MGREPLRLSATDAIATSRQCLRGLPGRSFVGRAALSLTSTEARETDALLALQVVRAM